MPHFVFANNNEICSKSADGTSSLAVDVCHSPGAPMPGVPVPYMNLCKAGDVTNGSRTVFIKGMEICLEDKSYFSTSYGDEPATKGLKKGTVSSAVQGKCHFINWSANVFVEGLAVTRHLDLVTHNHSNPGNTPSMPYVSRDAASGDCKNDIDAVKRECAEDPQKTNNKPSRLSKVLPKAQLDKLGRTWDSLKTKLGYRRDSQNAWIEDHCDGLWLRPLSDTQIETQFKDDPGLRDALKGLTRDFESQLRDITGSLEKFFKDKLQEAQSQLSAAVIERLERQLAIKVASQGVKAVGKGAIAAIPLAGWIISGLWTGYDIYDIATSAAELKQLTDAMSLAKALITDNQRAMKELSDLVSGMARKSALQLYSDAMGVLARVNDCTRAKRCLLIEFDDTSSFKDTFKGKGCCPGQTGHHLIPQAMAKSGCPGYNHDKAPVVCVEGNNQYQGTHGQIHSALTEMTDNFKKRGGTSLSYEQAREMGVKSLTDTFPESKCDPKCLRKQLDQHYKQQCTGQMTPNSGAAGGGSGGGSGGAN